MIRFRIGLCLLLALFNITAFSQTPPAQLVKTFSSLEGGYIVDVPWTARTAGAGRLSSTETYALGEGRYIKWSAGDILMEAAFIDFDPHSKVPRDSLATFQELVRRSGEIMAASGWQLAGDRAVIASGAAGREFVFESAGDRQITRWFFHGGGAGGGTGEFVFPVEK